VLLDLMLSGWGDGLAIAAAIRSDPVLVHTPIIVVSAALHVLRQHATDLTQLDCQVLQKPFDLDNLLGLIAGALASAQN
jgi:CheY-like chemotaxis protein